MEMKNFKRAYLLVLLITAPVWLLAYGNNTDGTFGTEVSNEETEVLAHGINIGIKYITIPEHPRGDYVPFSNCPQDKVSKFEFRV